MSTRDHVFNCVDRNRPNHGWYFVCGGFADCDAIDLACDFVMCELWEFPIDLFYVGYLDDNGVEIPVSTGPQLVFSSGYTAH